MNAVLILDLVGTFAFAAVGVIAGLHKGIDVLGAFLLGCVTGLGGGIIRDLVLDLPVSAFHNAWYLPVVLLVTTLTFLFPKPFILNYRVLLILDALGLGTFAVIGTEKAIQSGTALAGTLVLGMISAAGGGMLKDMLLGEMPLVLRKEIYMTSALLGSIIFCVLHPLLPLQLNFLFSALVTLLLRLLSLKKRLNLPFKLLQDKNNVSPAIE
ncbi:MAG: hypothetical protein C4288_18405 [Leptolyngbya sp. ERB_1_1]